ncbi:hypothetical protein [Sedimenticola hydrogenitrophicus]|uniref:hypothetical protein n=1 Tax=Sedimenticola hydrogenitrophicus TaxID=2967975 RepID=UPI0021A95D38|nr:hypothetical protein [Sedimenticola hydrogenitrophicus]
MAIVHRIQHRLALAFVAVALIPALVIGTYSERVSSRSLLDRELDAQRQGVDNARRVIEGFLDSARGDVLYLSQSRPMQALVRAREQGETGDQIHIDNQTRGARSRARTGGDRRIVCAIRPR